jgi:hypothetical protein
MEKDNQLENLISQDILDSFSDEESQMLIQEILSANKKWLIEPVFSLSSLIESIKSDSDDKKDNADD